MDTQGLLCNNQWGFRKNYSTESLLLHLTETWRNALDKGLKVGVLFIDFRKAFDTVNHTISGLDISARPLAQASVKTDGRVQITDHSPGLASTISSSII